MDLLFPPGPCVLCGLESGTGPAPGICLSCWRARRRPAHPLCATCGVPFPKGGSASEGDACGGCLSDPPAFVAQRSAYLYEGPVRAWILLYKDRRRYPLANQLGKALARTVLRDWPDLRFDLVVPVPGTLGRRMTRGFDSAALVARAAARALGLPSRETLRLTRVPRPQKGLTAVQRRENLRGAFWAAKGEVNGRCLLLVDDVMTTGTTLREAARVLRAAGATVYAASVAMTPERRLDSMAGDGPQEEISRAVPSENDPNKGHPPRGNWP
jgi:ComF family protein